MSKARLLPFIPQGAYYVLAEASRFPGDTAQARARFLLNEVGIAAVPGTAFCHHASENPGEGYLRFCFGITECLLEGACFRLARLA